MHSLMESWKQRSGVFAGLKSLEERKEQVEKDKIERLKAKGKYDKAAAIKVDHPMEKMLAAEEDEKMKESFMGKLA